MESSRIGRPLSKPLWILGNHRTLLPGMLMWSRLVILRSRVPLLQTQPRHRPTPFVRLIVSKTGHQSPLISQTSRSAGMLELLMGMVILVACMRVK
jgi:hypothetical protein